MWTKLQVAMGKLISKSYHFALLDGEGEGGKNPQTPTTSTGKVKSLLEAANRLRTITTKILGPILTIIGVAAVIYTVYLGVMYAKAESADKRKDIQGRLVGACIGAVIIIAGATLCFALDWTKIYHSFAKESGCTEWVDGDGDGWCDNCAAIAEAAAKQ